MGVTSTNLSGILVFDLALLELQNKKYVGQLLFDICWPYSLDSLYLCSTYLCLLTFILDADLEGKSPDEQEMMKLMGFCAFDTTKGKKVAGNEVGTVHVILKRKYRQYMNRKGGFNRPLDFVA